MRARVCVCVCVKGLPFDIYKFDFGGAGSVGRSITSAAVKRGGSKAQIGQCQQADTTTCSTD